MKRLLPNWRMRLNTVGIDPRHWVENNLGARHCAAEGPGRPLLRLLLLLLVSARACHRRTAVAAEQGVFFIPVAALRAGKPLAVLRGLFFFACVLRPGIMLLMPLRVCAGAVFFITCPVVRRTAFGTNHDVLSVLELLVTDRTLVTKGGRNCNKNISARLFTGVLFFCQ